MGNCFGRQKHGHRSQQQSQANPNNSFDDSAVYMQQRALPNHAQLRNVLDNIRPGRISSPIQKRISQMQLPAINKPKVVSKIPSDKSSNSPHPQLIPKLMKDVATYCNNWVTMDYGKALQYVTLTSNSSEFEDILELFTRTNKSFYKVSRIERVQNPYLYASYLLKKEELHIKYGKIKEMLLFHGTKSENIDGICSDNFNWRLYGKGTGHKFGQGVSFSPISYYASHYCDQDSFIKIMLVAKVLISQSCVGETQMALPPQGFDTMQKENGRVIVKYNDNEFYPAYKIYFRTNRFYILEGS